MSTAAHATQALHISFAAAVAAGNLRMVLTPASYTDETEVTLTMDSGGSGSWIAPQGGGKAGNTAITVPDNITAQSLGSGVDTFFAGGSNEVNHPELQNDIVPRIKDIVNLKNQTGWAGAINSHDNVKKAPHLFRPLGRSSNFDEYKPAWSVDVLEGAITGSVDFTPLEYSASANKWALGGAGSRLRVPQLDVLCEYSLTYKKELGKSHELWLRKSTDDFLFDISEINVDDTEENFTLEVFKYIYKDEQIVDMVPLKLSEDEFGDEFVDYFFDVRVDKDAEEDVVIKYIDQEVTKAKIVDKCKDGQPSCAQEKVLQLESQVSTLKSENLSMKGKVENLDLVAAQVVAGAQITGCDTDSDCPVYTKCHPSGLCYKPPRLTEEAEFTGVDTAGFSTVDEWVAAWKEGKLKPYPPKYTPKEIKALAAKTNLGEQTLLEEAIARLHNQWAEVWKLATGED